MIRPLLTAAALAVAVVTTPVALAAWRVACPVPPEERMHGTRPSVRAMVRHVLGCDRVVATGGAPL